MSFLLLREISGQWDHRLIVRPNFLCWNYQDHPYLRAPIPLPESGTIFSNMKQFRFHARRTGGNTFTNFKVERGAYPQAGMKLWYTALPCLDVALEDDARNKQLDPYVVNYFPAAVVVAGDAPNLDGFTGVEVPLTGAGAAFDTAQYDNHGFVGCIMRMCLGITADIVGTGVIPGPSVSFSYQQL